MEVVFINLDRAGDRRAFMQRQGERLGLPLARLRAVEAEEVLEADVQRLSVQWERPITRPELAAFLSHRAAWERAAKSADGLIVLEDDAVLSPRFPRALKEMPSDFDLINLENFERRKFFRGPAQKIAEGVSVAPVRRDKAGAAAYFLTPAGARKLLALAHTHAAPADAFLYAVGGLNVGQIEPALAIQAQFLALRGLDVGFTPATSIHQPRSRLPIRWQNLRYGLRRAATQLRLTGLHARRLLDLDFRKPCFDEAEFRAILPIDWKPKASQPGGADAFSHKER